ncbi:MAG: alpha/beta hydrolase [Planctomycetaceae bacterium]|nr:alpha/beta hydrolase [Planctomycetaceae bacterium]
MIFTWLQSRTSRRLIELSALLALLYVFTCVYFWATQVPKILAPLPDQPSHPVRMGMPCEEVRIPLPPNGSQTREPLHAFWVPAENSDAPIFLYLHGQDATRGKNLEHTETFHQCGYHVLVVDYRGYAESYGTETPSEATVYEDAVASLNYLTGKFASHRIFIYGHSLGGAVAIELATRKEAEGTAGLIVESTFTSIADMSAWKYYGLLRLLPIDFLLTERFDSLSKIESINRPILLIHGKADSKVPYQMSQTLYEKAGKRATLHLVEGADHEDCCWIGKVEYRQQVRDFVANCRKIADLGP